MSRDLSSGGAHHRASIDAYISSAHLKLVRAVNSGLDDKFLMAGLVYGKLKIVEKTPRKCSVHLITSCENVHVLHFAHWNEREKSKMNEAYTTIAIEMVSKLKNLKNDLQVLVSIIEHHETQLKWLCSS